MSKKLRKKEIRKEKDQKQVREPVPLYGNPGSSTKTHTGTGSPKLGTGFQGVLPNSQTQTNTRNRFPKTGNRVPEPPASLQIYTKPSGIGSPKLGTGFQTILP